VHQQQLQEQLQASQQATAVGAEAVSFINSGAVLAVQAAAASQ
jgi:hypothetical protein